MEKPLREPFTRRAVTGIAALLRGGGVVVFPTDTLYGFHCLARCASAVNRIRRLKEGEKGRASKKPARSGERGAGRRGFILLAADMEMVDRCVSRWPGGARESLSRIWPAPLTAILPASKRIDRKLAPQGRVAVRIPDLPVLRELVRRCGQPLVSTSVNITGSEPLTRISEIMRAFPGLGGYFSRPGRPKSGPSTIVDMTASPPRLVRPGRQPWPPW